VPGVTLTAGTLNAGSGITLTGSITTNPASGSSSVNATSIDLNGSTRTFNVARGTASTDLIVSSAIANGSFVKSGAGSMNLTGNSTYSGGTTVSQGTLIVSGSISGTISVSHGAELDVAAGGAIGSSSAISVQGTLGGGGSLGAVDGQNGGVVAPGPAGAVGTLSMVSLNLEPGANLSLKLGGTAHGTSDSLVLSGGVSLAGGLQLSIVNGYSPELGSINSDGSILARGDVIYLTAGATSLSGAFSNAINGLDGAGPDPGMVVNGTPFAIFYGANAASQSLSGGNDIALMGVPEPESTTLAMAAGTLLAALGRPRRNRMSSRG
jgi:autotransporter-associated beta strand protein